MRTRAFFFLTLRSAAPSEASRHFNQDRHLRAKFFVSVLLWGAQAASLFLFSSLPKSPWCNSNFASLKNVVGKLPTTAGLFEFLLRFSRLEARWPHGQGACATNALRTRGGAASARARRRLRLLQWQVGLGQAVLRRPICSRRAFPS